MPTVWIALHDALVPHCASAAFLNAGNESASADGEQMSAQYLSPVEDWSAHCGVAEAPAGLSVGQVVPVHLGTQTGPVTPWIWTATSSEPQPAEGF